MGYVLLFIGAAWVVIVLGSIIRDWAMKGIRRMF